jgi:hypothetical protein
VTGESSRIRLEREAGRCCKPLIVSVKGSAVENRASITM